MNQTIADRSLRGLKQDLSLAKLTTLKIGGTARYLVEIQDIQQLQEACNWAEQQGLPVLFLGEGSNLLFSDHGFPGLLIQNRIRGKKASEDEVEVGGGENLGTVIRWMNRLQLGGIERMYGIPGTVAGALVGNAGAYGQEIGALVVDVRVWINNRIELLSASELCFRYRWSVFKESRDLFILSCRLRLRKSSRNLQKISDEILSKRLLKYPEGLRCPGSFFKNVLLDNVCEEALQRIPDDFIMFGKIPAGKLLETVGANGARRGDAQFATYHGNLIANRGRANSKDMLQLAREYARHVWDHFRIRLETEVVIVDDLEWGDLTR